MSRREGIITKKCGCVHFEYGPPVRCVEHLARDSRKKARAKVLEEKGLRRAAHDRAAVLGHDLTPFREYPSQNGKWTAWCRHCGAMTIVYDQTPDYDNDQVIGLTLTDKCKRSALFAALKDSDGL